LPLPDRLGGKDYGCAVPWIRLDPQKGGFDRRLPTFKRLKEPLAVADQQASDVIAPLLSCETARTALTSSSDIPARAVLM
jgi:hypothetical protein